MYCKHCLAANPAEASKCVQCGASLADAVGAVPASGGAGDLDLQEHPAPAGDPTGLGAPSGGPIGGPPPRADEPAKPEAELPPMPPDNKMWAIGTMVGSLIGAPCSCFTCFAGVGGMFALIFGLLALLESGKIATFYEEKAYDAALEASKRTKTFTIIGVALLAASMLVGIVFNVAFYGLGFFTNFMSRYQKMQ